VEKCVDVELPQRVADAAAIFTGTVRDLVTTTTTKNNNNNYYYYYYYY